MDPANNDMPLNENFQTNNQQNETKKTKQGESRMVIIEPKEEERGNTLVVRQASLTGPNGAPLCRICLGED